MSAPSLRALARIAVRDARRNRGRTLLIVALIALPVGGLAAAQSLDRAMAGTPEQRAASSMGQADLHLMPSHVERPDLGAAPGGLRAEQDSLRSLLPAGSRIETIRDGGVLIELPGRRKEVTASDVDLGDGALGEGMYELIAGRAPVADGEIAASVPLLDKLGVELGESLALATDLEGSSTQVAVVGAIRSADWHGAEHVAFAPGAADGFLTSSYADNGTAARYLVRLPPGADPGMLPSQIRLYWWSEDGTVGDDVAFEGFAREDIAAQPHHSEVQRATLLVVGGLALFEAGLIAGAAFAIGVRRRQRELGLLAATGADRRQMRLAVLLIGAVTGLVGAGAGVALGMALTAVAHPHLDRVSQRTSAPLAFDAGWLLLVAALGAGAAALAAVAPALGAARLPVLTALSGRRPPARPASRGLAIGLAAIFAGGAFTLWTALRWALTEGMTEYRLLAGAVTVVAGFGLCSPWLLEQLGRAARYLPTAPRLALREAARFRARNGPVVTAAMAGLAGSIALSALLAADAARSQAQYAPQLQSDRQILVSATGEGGDQAAERIAGDVGGDIVGFRMLDWGSRSIGPREGLSWDGHYPSLAAGDVALLAALGGAAATEAFEAGSAVALVPGVAGAADFLRLQVTDYGDGALDGGEESSWPVTLPLTSLDVWPAGGQLPNVLVSEQTMRDRNLATPEGEEFTYHYWLVTAPAPLTHRQIAAAERIAAQEDAWVTVERGFVDMRAPMRRWAVAAAALVGLAVVAVATGLAAAEARHDEQILAAVGGAPNLRRVLSAARAGLLAALGGALAVPAGLVPAWAVSIARQGSLPLVVPWPAIAVAVAVVPLMAAGGAALLVRGRLMWADVKAAA